MRNLGIIFTLVTILSLILMGFLSIHLFLIEPVETKRMPRWGTDNISNTVALYEGGTIVRKWKSDGGVYHINNIFCFIDSETNSYVMVSGAISVEKAQE